MLWKEVNLIGRKKLAEKLESLIKHRKRFVLKGVKGVGKSALLEFAHELTRANHKSALISGNMTYSNLLKKIVADWELDVEPSKSGNPTNADMEQAILQQQDHFVFVDNLDDAKGQKVYFLKILAERHVMNAAMISGVKVSEELRQFLWFIRNEVKVDKLEKAYCDQLARKVCVYLGSKASIEEVAAYAHGLPGRIVAFATAGEVGKHEITLQSEELDISPVLLILGAGIVVFRYIGRATDATDFVLLGGVGMIFVLILRFVMQQGKEKKN